MEIPASYITAFVRNNSSEAAGEKEKFFKIHHINQAGSSNLKFWLACANCASLSGLCTQIYSTLMLLYILMYLEHLMCQTVLKEERHTSK